jgi:SagB-type dehydrogenase family enzyme
MTWREYHESTKHSVQSLRRSQHFLDWKNMPDPFRHYEGAPLLDLPADPPGSEIPALDLLHGAYGASRAVDGPRLLSELLFYSAAISASKLVPSTGDRYALRVNPSSGNLHPTEFHFATRGLEGWPDGLYHYRPSSHTAEQRATGDFAMRQAGAAAPITFILTSIAWREAWKYRDRAYRYCLHDVGHAWQAVALAARASGCDSFASGLFVDDEIAQACRLSGDEWPMLLVEIRSRELPAGSLPLRDPDGGATVWHGGHPNQLSEHRVSYPLIDAIQAATKSNPAAEPIPDCVDEGSGEISLPAPASASSERAFGEVARLRRSALDFRGGAESISLAQLSAILVAASGPLTADFGDARFVQFYLYAHRVDDLAPGVYRYWPRQSRLEQIRAGDQRVAAAGLSLGQDLAGNACVAFSMIGDLERAARMHGDRGYRYVHFEAGAIGHRLYLAAEALGLGATGIGAFYDDEVHHYLNLTSRQRQVVYHFAIGYPVPDPRVSA